MKLITLLAAFAGLDLVTAKPPPRAPPAANPGEGSSRGMYLWHPPDTYLAQRWKRMDWGIRCDRALQAHDCMSGIIHGGRRAEIGDDGKRTGRYYHNVEELKLGDWHEPKRLRVYDDGTSTLGWTDRDFNLVRKSKLEAAKRSARNLANAPPQTTAQGDAKRKAERQLAGSKGPDPSPSEAFSHNGFSKEESWRPMEQPAKRRKFANPFQRPAESTGSNF